MAVALVVVALALVTIWLVRRRHALDRAVVVAPVKRFSTLELYIEEALAWAEPEPDQEPDPFDEELTDLAATSYERLVEESLRSPARHRMARGSTPVPIANAAPRAHVFDDDRTS